MPPRMLERWLTSEDRTELAAYYRVKEEQEAQKKAAQATEALANKNRRKGI